jgi:hypothetical protein
MRTEDKIRSDPRVEKLFSEPGNIDPDKIDWWCWLKSGWVNGEDPGVHSIHEQTLTEVLRVLRRVEPCSCKYCLLELEKPAVTKAPPA